MNLTNTFISLSANNYTFHSIKFDFVNEKTLLPVSAVWSTFHIEPENTYMFVCTYK